ncbi:MAG: type II toxin-antitoxin system RelE/ParE family toxin [Desulfamplus sp.]|nr:type II toxin-antitoxin system RelE/ParE family toxin [Desulfamplus sp.]
MKIVWSPLAIEKVEEISDYIAKDKPSAAEEWLNTLFAKVERLETSPKRGRMVPEINSESFRELIYGNYRIIYRIAKDQLAVLTIHHGKQLLIPDTLD